MDYMFRSRSGVVVERRTTPLDYGKGIEHLIEALDRERGAFFSSNVEDPGRYSRWDMAFVNPPLEFVGRGRRLALNALNERGVRLLAMLRPLLGDGEGSREVVAEERRLVIEVAEGGGFFAEEERSRQPSLLSPLRRLIADFAGLEDRFLGLYGAFGYDLLFRFERIALGQERSPESKELHLFLPDRILVVDRRKEIAQRHDFAFSDGAATTAGAADVPFAPLPPPAPAPAVGAGAIASDHDDAEYAAKVEIARRRMRAGDIFEVVLSRQFSTRYPGAPSALYRRMRRLNPSPYEVYCQFGDEQLVGTSPEMFVRVEGDRVETSPISGTIGRGADAMEDAARIRDLYNSEKDEVELTMCTDVDRNDKARICEAGSVRLLSRRKIERYAGLFHTVDHVEGRLRPGFDGIDAFLSHMWAVTLTGAPKRKAVEIIEAMEKTPRGWYGGAVGALLLNGGVNTGITIRTVHLERGTARYRVGASLVYDSVPEEEERETRIKATPFFRALEAAEAGAPPARPAARAGDRPGSGAQVLMIDNEDSFVHTLADYFRQAGAEVRTYRAGIAAARIVAEAPDLVIHSPGPGRPADFGLPALVRELAGHGLAQFGVCLGLQGIAEAFGGTLALLDDARHGKSWQVRHTGTGIFSGLPSPCPMGAYHSLYAVRERLPEALAVTAWNEHGLVMGLRHRTLPIEAVQFHPESILSMPGGAGRRLIGNVVRSLIAPAERAPGAPTRPPADREARARWR